MDDKRKKLLIRQTVKAVADARDLFAAAKKERPKEPGWYTTQELADHWGVAASTGRERILKLVRAGTMERQKFGNGYLCRLAKHKKA